VRKKVPCGGAVWWLRAATKLEIHAPVPSSSRSTQHRPNPVDRVQQTIAAKGVNKRVLVAQIVLADELEAVHRNRLGVARRGRVCRIGRASAGCSGYQSSSLRKGRVRIIGGPSCDRPVPVYRPQPRRRPSRCPLMLPSLCESALCGDLCAGHLYAGHLYAGHLYAGHLYAGHLYAGHLCAGHPGSRKPRPCHVTTGR